MGQRKKWTPEERRILEEQWGTRSVGAIAKKLNRSPQGVILKAQRMGLGPFIQNGDYLTLNEFTKLITGYSGGGDLKKTLKGRGLKTSYKKIIEKRVEIVKTDDIWRFLEANKTWFNMNRIPPLAFGEEPAWVREQRIKHFYNKESKRTTPWTAGEEKELLRLIELGLGYREISERLRRSEGAIQRRLCDMRTSLRPDRADNHNPYTEDEKTAIFEAIANGDTWTQIKERTHRSEKALRGFVYRALGTENLDKRRRILKEKKTA